MDLMTLKILLPYKIFAELKNVSRIVAESTKGSFGILPHRLDCTAALIPGIITYEEQNGIINYIAVDEGILIKTGKDVIVSVRNAIAGANLGMLREKVEEQFSDLDEKEKNLRSVLAKLESGFIHSFQKLRKD
jgi:F-type H+-transporting ATPase subunit epsilon